MLYPSLHSIAQDVSSMNIPFLKTQPIIDGDLSDWKADAYSDGTWDLSRVKKAEWYDPKRNKLTGQKEEDTTSIDLAGDYYMAWDYDYLYFGATVIDNKNDVTESNHEPKRWYYKDAIAWFLEFPQDTLPEKFMDGDHAFAFIADTTYPDYGAWWRHGTADKPYIEQAIPKDAVTYNVQMQEGSSNYTIEARIDVAKTLGVNKSFKGLKEGEKHSMMVVHCDPDGGEYGGHLLIHGAGDLDSTWSEIVLVGSKHD